ncbi:hypothetical protein M3Y99_01392000 [Aphelenchoides fujianensis]|nr:hypothetical protein M3Y99_01392000 [Aphelenchoides fujianensis]
MTKMRLMLVLFVCAIVPLAVQTAAIRPAANETAANTTVKYETAVLFSDTSAMPPVYREGFEAGRKEGFDLGFRVCLEYVTEIIAEKKQAAYKTMWRVVYFVGAAALFACVLLCCSGKDEQVGEKTPLFGAQKKYAAYV